jgi:hypothetical protein
MIWKVTFSLKSGQKPAALIDTSRPTEDLRQKKNTLPIHTYS